MLVDAVLFDLDGTLCDTLADIAAAVNRVLHCNGFPVHSEDAIRMFVGEGAAQLIERALPAAARDQKTIDRCLEEFRLDYRDSWHHATHIYPGIAELLDELTRRKFLLSILSNKPHEPTSEMVTAILGSWPFAAVFGQRDGVPRKPDPTAAWEICQIMETSPERVLFVGDTAIDMMTARAARMFPVGVLWGFRSKEELLAAGAKVILQHPLELLGILESDEARRI